MKKSTVVGQVVLSSIDSEDQQIMWQRGGRGNLGVCFSSILSQLMEKIVLDKYCSQFINTNKCQIDASDGVCSRVYQ